MSATLRNARIRDAKAGPDLLQAAQAVIKGGADSITMHLREDRRHILDADVVRMRKVLTVPLNLEMAATAEMLRIALKLKTACGVSGAGKTHGSYDRRRAGCCCRWPYADGGDQGAGQSQNSGGPFLLTRIPSKSPLSPPPPHRQLNCIPAAIAMPPVKRSWSNCSACRMPQGLAQQLGLEVSCRTRLDL